MRALASLSIVGLIASLAVSGCGAGEATTASSLTGSDQAGAAKPESPPIRQVSIRAASGTDPRGFTFAPPLDSNPSLSGADAAVTAWEYYLGGNVPSSVSVVLENVTWTGGDLDGLDGRDVWVATYPDACVDLYGPYRPGSPPRRCVLQSFSTMIDADMGTFVVSFAPGSSSA